MEVRFEPFKNKPMRIQRSPIPARRERSRYIIFTPERGVLSEHCTLNDAVVAYYYELQGESPIEPTPAIYQQVDFDWKQVGPPVESSARLTSRAIAGQHAF
jgi:hypothetical protein